MSYPRGLDKDGYDYFTSAWSNRRIVEDCQVIKGVAFYGEANLNGELMPYDQPFDRARAFINAMNDQRFSGFHL